MSQALVSLVGTSPIPILLAHYDLCEEGMDHILVASSDTFTYAEAIQKLTGCRPPEKIMSEKDPKGCIEQLRSLRESYPEGTLFHLNYTGGTKAMVAGGLVAFGQNKAGSWYLDESENIWRSLDGQVQPSVLRLTLPQIAGLHGYSTIPSERVLDPSLKELRDYLVTWWQIRDDRAELNPINRNPRLREDGALLEKLASSAFRKSLSGAVRKGQPTPQAQAVLRLIERLPETAGSVFPLCDLSRLRQAVGRINGSLANALDYRHPGGAAVQAAASYLTGSCLEDLVIKGFEESGLLIGCQILGSTIIHPTGKTDPRFHRELDICIIRPNGLIVVSVTACTDKKTVQHKMEEALTLAKEVGGYSAKAVVISGASKRDLEILRRVNKVAANVRPTGCETLKLLLEGKYKAFAQAALGGLI